MLEPRIENDQDFDGVEWWSTDEGMESKFNEIRIKLKKGTKRQEQ